MSRCFPFPPPGYELKGRLDDVNLIVKEKHKPKKHRDKKEKKERSERREKERGEEDKHKEDKKRKREKHKDKKDKKKDKRSSSGEKKSVGSLENQNGHKLVPDSKLTVRIQDKKAVVELGNRVRNDGATGLHTVQKITNVEKENTDLLGNVQENGNGILGIIKDTRDHIVESKSLENGRNFVGEDQIKVEEEKKRNGYDVGEGDVSKNEDQNKNKKAEDKERKKEKKRKKEEKRKKREKKELMGFTKDEATQETNNGKFLEFHSNIPSDLLKENNDCPGKLPKLKELNGFLHAKDSGVRPSNMSRPAIVSHQVAQNGSGFHPSQDTTNSGVGKQAVITDQKVNGNLSSPQSVIDNVRNIGSCKTAKTENGRVNINNRVMSNGIISPHIVRIERKMEPKVLSSHPLVENGGKMAMLVPDEAVRKRESRMNGSLDSKHHLSSMPSSDSLIRMEKVVVINSTADGKAPFSYPLGENGGKMAMQISDAAVHKKESRTSGSLDSKKAKFVTNVKPHPDLKYLSKILTVPEVEWPQGDDDQEWLFDPRTKRAKLASPDIQWTKEVWSEAVHLNSADVTALPYVIPY